MESESHGKRDRTLTFTLVATFLALLPTAYVTFISNSITLFADLLRCVVEFLAILIAYIISRKTQPKNLQHYHYGFEKLEHVSGLAVGGAMLVAFVVTAFAAVERLIHPVQVENAGLGLLLALLSVLGNLYIWGRNARLLAFAPSPLSVSQARLFRSKTLACTAVTASLTLSIYSPDTTLGMLADPAGSLAVAGFLLYSSYAIIFQSLGEIVDWSLEESAHLLIMKALVKYESHYTTLVGIRTRRGGEKNYIELSLEFDGRLALSEIHRRSQEISQEITRQIPAAEVTIVPLPAKISQ
ncbi:MAG: cation diffusion facilitator family transporter [Deltaproteobacteria bacterium]|nr:cation diffusion facilitator family transporter [Deltaproteobacteria bacterium]